MVAGFVQSAPNETLMQVAAREWRASARLLDIGCGAGRNAIPLAQSGWLVVGTDLSRSMVAELNAAGFVLDASVPLRELNRPPGALRTSGPPVIYEGLFRRRRD